MEEKFNDLEGKKINEFKLQKNLKKSQIFKLNIYFLTFQGFEPSS